MSFTVAEVLATAYVEATVAARNVDAATRLRFVNRALTAYQRDLGSQDVVVTLSSVSLPPLTALVETYDVSDQVTEVDGVEVVEYRQSSSDPWSDPLGQINLKDASGWAQESGQPVYWYLYRPGGVPTFGFVPKPSAAYVVAGAELRLRVTAKQAPVTSEDDFIYLPVEALTAMGLLVARFMVKSDGQPEKSPLLIAEAKDEMKKNAESLLRQGSMVDHNLCPSVLTGEEF